jgi:hypothetical protein
MILWWKNIPQQNFMFELHILADFIKIDVVKTLNWCSRKQLQDSMVLFLGSQILFFQKKDFFDNVENCSLVKKTKRTLSVNS